ncbi:MAG: nucleotidyltransferase domain-containing protein [bacterium]|nr:nucleotidyltransferase domain-containing protein [bacterium]
MTTDEVMAASVAIIRRHAGSVCGRVLLFGSRARGGAHAGSDIDLGIAGDAPLPQSIMARIRADIEELRTLHSVDVVDMQSVNAQFRAAILAHRIVLYEQHEAAA